MPIRFQNHSCLAILAGVFFLPGCWLATTARADAPTLILDTGPATPINAIAWSSTGDCIAAGMQDGRIDLIDARSHQVENTIHAGLGEVDAVAFSPDGGLLAAGGMPTTADSPSGDPPSGLVQVWDRKSGRLLLSLADFPDNVSALAFAADGRTLATLAIEPETDSNGGTITIEGTPQALEREGVKQIDKSHPNSDIKVWDVRSGKLLRTVVITGDDVSLAYAPNGKWMAVASLPHAEAKAGKTQFSVIQLYETKSYALHGALKRPASDPVNFAWSPDSRTIAAGYTDPNTDNLSTGPIRLWDVAAGRVRATLAGNAGAQQGKVGALVWAGNNRLIADRQNQGDGDDDRIQSWNVPGGEMTGELEGVNGSIAGIALSPDGKFLAGGGEPYGTMGNLCVWDVNSRKRVFSSIGHNAHLMGLAVSHDGLLATPCQVDVPRTDPNSDVKVWNLSDGRLAASMSSGDLQCSLLKFSGDNRFLLGAGKIDVFEHTDHLLLWSRPGFRLARSIHLKGTVSALDIAPDSRTAVTALSPQKIFGHFESSQKDAVTTGYPVVPWQFPALVPEPPLPTPNLDAQGALFSPDNRYLAEFGPSSQGTGVTVRNRNDWSILWKTPGLNSPSGNYWQGPEVGAFAGDSTSLFTGDLRNVKSGQVIRSLTTLYVVNAIASRPVPPGAKWGPEFALACEGGLVRIWNTKTATVSSEIQQPRYLVALAYTADGTHLVTLCEDGAVRIWGADDHKLRATLQVLNETVDSRGYVATDWITTTPEGYYAASPGAEQYIRWNVDGKLYPAAAFHNRYYRPDLVAKALTVRPTRRDPRALPEAEDETESAAPRWTASGTNFTFAS